MDIKLKRLWYGPDERRRREGIHTVPDSFRDKLPPDAEILGEGAAKALKAAKPAPAAQDTLRDFDSVRAAGEAEDKARKKAEAAEAEAAARAAEFQRQLEEEAKLEALAEGVDPEPEPEPVDEPPLARARRRAGK